MSFIDYFAWFIRIVLFVSAVAILIAMELRPAKSLRSEITCGQRPSKWRGGTLIFGFVLWPISLVWAYVEVPKREASK
jgi:hypothetical protein